MSEIDVDKEVERLPRKKRFLSLFLAREMVYDYVKKSLPDTERDAFEECLENHPELRRDTEYLESAISYCDKLKQTQVTPALIQSLARPPKGIRSVKSAWRHSSPTLRFAFQAAAITGFFIGLVPYIPWNVSNLKLPKFETLTEVPRANSESPEIVDDLEVPPQQAVQIETQTPKPKEQAAPDSPPKSGPEVPAVGTATQGLAPAIDRPTTDPAAQDSKSAPTSVTATTPPTNSETPKRKGYVYRGNLFSKNPDQATRDLISYLETQGGKKAGEVDLGWKKREGYYFHFEFQEGKYNALMEYLNSLGRVRIERFPHSRIMPENSLRIILLVETPAFPASPQVTAEPAEELNAGPTDATVNAAPGTPQESSASPSP